MRRDFTWKLLSRPSSPSEGEYHIDLTPKPNAAIVWGKVAVHIDAAKRPTRIEYFNERGVLKRTISFHDYKEISGRAVPMRMKVTPDTPNELTEMIYDTLEFDVSLSPRLFSLQALKR